MVTGAERKRHTLTVERRTSSERCATAALLPPNPPRVSSIGDRAPSSQPHFLFPSCHRTDCSWLFSWSYFSLSTLHTLDWPWFDTRQNPTTKLNHARHGDPTCVFILRYVHRLTMVRVANLTLLSILEHSRDSPGHQENATEKSSEVSQERHR